MIVKLHVIHGQPAGKTLVFGPGDYYFGRGGECQVRFNSDWVSRQHCLLRVTPTAGTLRDLGSRNGTLINGTLCEAEQSLSEGDQIQVGPVTFRVILEGDTTAAAPEPLVTLRPEGEESATRKSPTDSTSHLPALGQQEGQD
jgi:pSer/pThr/pTyr-binding forkhead associated (FHA) protein